MLSTRAPAKINLYLHVTGRREDGYHLLDSLVAFTNVGDALRLEETGAFGLEIEGPMARALAGEASEQNLVVRAAQALAAALDRPLDFKLVLTKNLPIASGIGGGSTDGAAALRLLAQYWGVRPTDPLLYKIAASLGQDVPCCLDAETCFFRGIGDTMESGPVLPPTDMVLVNPGVPVPTPAVFKARQGAFTPAAEPFFDPVDVRALATLLAARENSLTAAAVGLCPVIETALAALSAQPDCLLSRMSGSGATCFGLFADRSAARAAAARLYEAHPDWWVVPAFISG